MKQWPVAFKIPNESIDKGENRFVTYWDEDDRKFIVTLYLLNPTTTTVTPKSDIQEEEKQKKEEGETKQETRV